MISTEAVFKIINFLAFCFVMVYLFKKYIGPYFVEEKKQFEDDINDKKTSRKLLQKQLDTLVESHADQVSQGKTLQKKCKQWSQYLKEIHEKEDAERAQMKDQMIRRRQEQWLFVQKQRCLQQKLPIIFRDVEQYFKEMNDKKDLSKKYCDTLLTFMKD